MSIRIGHGYDVHAFGGAGPLRLGGVAIPHIHGLLAHSDGDVLIHAVCDALLGAIAASDIGHHFPDTDDAYRGIDGLTLLGMTWSQVTRLGYELSNLDVSVIAQVPKLAGYIESMRAHLAECLGADPNQVNVKATTTEHLGFVGREEGIAVHAVVLIRRAVC